MTAGPGRSLTPAGRAVTHGNGSLNDFPQYRPPTPGSEGAHTPRDGARTPRDGSQTPSHSGAHTPREGVHTPCNGEFPQHYGVPRSASARGSGRGCVTPPGAFLQSPLTPIAAAAAAAAPPQRMTPRESRSPRTPASGRKMSAEAMAWTGLPEYAGPHSAYSPRGPTTPRGGGPTTPRGGGPGTPRGERVVHSPRTPVYSPWDGGLEGQVKDAKGGKVLSARSFADASAVRLPGAGAAVAYSVSKSPRISRSPRKAGVDPGVRPPQALCKDSGVRITHPMPIIY